MNVVELHAPSATSRALCGGKGAQLAAAIARNMPVPGGLVVTVEAFSSFLESLGVQSMRTEMRTADAERASILASEIRGRITAAPFPPSVEQDVLRLLENVARGPHPTSRWAVRSSAVAEDTQSASFAGQYDSTLGVDTSGVAAAIVNTWASSFTERATLYRRARGTTEDRMAVVVQRLVHATTAGVCFTKDPVTDGDQVTINANYGLGESVVGGHASPDTYTVDRGTLEVVSRVAGRKEMQVDLGENGVVSTSVPAHKREAFCLTDRQASDIAGLALSLEAHHAGPVDVEWAYEREHLYLLQVRAITPNGPSRRPGWTPDNNTAIDPRYPLYSNGNISEVMPGCVTPLSWDHTGRIIEHAFRAQLEALGAIDGSAGEQSVLGFFFHRPYVNVSLLTAAAARTPGMTPDTVREEFIGKDAITTRAVRWVDFLPHRMPRLLRVLRVVVKRSMSLSRDVEASLRSAEDDAMHFTDDTVASAPDEMLLDYVRMSDELAAPSVVHVWASTLASVAFTQLRRSTDKWLDDDSGALASELVTGIDNLPSVEPAIALHALSQKVAQSEQLAALFSAEDNDEALVRALRRHPEQVGFEAFIRQYGHRGVAEAELSRPCWREDPGQVVALMRNNLRAGALSPTDVGDRQRGVHREAMKRIEPLPWWQRAWLRVLIRRTRTGFLHRETMKDVVIRRLDRSRVVYREINRRLVARRLTATSDDMFFLHWHEVKELLTNVKTPEEIGEIIDSRRKDYERCLNVDVPKVQQGTPCTLDVSDLPDGQALAGMGVSPGRVTGVARVVSDPRDGAYIDAGEILVAPVTDVAWTPLFAQAAGLVVEVGGLLSHGSIVAREYGIPAVVGVAGATRTIRTGDRVTVDGATGQVFRVGPAENHS